MALRMSERSELLNAAGSGDGAHNRANWLISRIRAAFNMSAPH
jgi:hypothetical protein